MDKQEPLNVRAAVITVAFLSPLAVAMALSSRFCPDDYPVRYSVSPSDINGKLEYCVGRHRYGGRGYPEMAIIEPGATCGHDKGPLTALAEAMSQKSTEAAKMCRNRSTWESLQELYQRWFGRRLS